MIPISLSIAKILIKPLLSAPRIVLLALFLIASASAQNSTTSVTDGKTPSGLAAGSPSGSYDLTSFENINLFNGNLNVHLGLESIGGRGSAAYQMMLALNLKSWHVKHFHRVMPNGDELDSYSPTQSGWLPYSGYGPGRLDGRNYGLNTGSNFSCRWYSKTLSRLTFSTADGTEYELRDQLSGGQPLDSTCSQGAYRGTVFITADGTAATFVSDTAIYDNPRINPVGPTGFSVSGYLMLRDGTRYRIDTGLVTWKRDRNGNKLSFTYDSYGRVTTAVDSLNRQTVISYDVSDVAPYGLCDQIILHGFAGAQRIIRVSKTRLENALKPGSGYSIQTLQQLFPELNGASSTTTHNPTVTSAVWLPDGRKYTFYYNSYGELARVEVPTGGAIEYDMTSGSGVIFGCQFCDEPQIYRRVIERRVYSDGSTGSTFDARTTYDTTGTSTPFDPRPWSSTVTVEQTDRNGVALSRERHFFDGSGVNSLFAPSGTTYSPWNEGKEKQTDLLDTNGAIGSTAVLRRTTQSWAQRAPVSWWSSWAAQEHLDPADEPPNDPRPTEVTTTLMDSNQVSKQTFSYDDSVPFNNQSDIYEYDFGSGSAGLLMRRTHTDYLTSANYTDPSGAHLRGLPSQTSIYDANGVERARATFEYDNYTVDGNHAGLIDRLGISGFDTAFITGYATRGNVTATTHYLLVNGSVTGSVAAFAQYDIAGNVVKTIDGRGFATTIDFTDRFGAPDGEARSNSAPAELSSVGQASYAFPSLVTDALGHTAYTQFDFYLGRPVDAEDTNGIVSSAYFNDALDRPTQAIRANNDNSNPSARSQTTLAYDDLNHVLTTTSDRDNFGDNMLKSQVIYDGLGRTTDTRQYETASAYITVRQTYDALGRSYQMSNPFRAGESILWTVTGYDALNRVISVTTPDNAVVSTSYSGNTVTVTDQAAKQRKSVTDALGRLTAVYEDPSGLNYLTSYSYDTLDDLITVNQAVQTRTFVYDSLKRLTSATNPESGTTSYQYDANGNLTQKTDARNVVTTHAYDALNRVTTTLYRINNQPDPNTGDVEYLYDNATNGKGRLWLTLTHGAHPFQTAVGSYDSLGQVKQLYRLFGNGQGGWYPSYDIAATYDLAGHIKTMTYPSNHSITNTFDNAGRLSSFTGNLGDGSPTPRNYATGISYSSFGSMTQEQFGTDTTPLYHKLHYNVRGQLYDVRVSTLSLTQNEFDWNRGCLAFYYGGAGWGQSSPTNNGNLSAQQHWIPADDAYSNYWYTQDNYNYDSLNRLNSVGEWHGGPWGQSGQDYQQAYIYDRYGNRTVDQVNTWGTGIPKPNFGVNTITNQLTAPAGYSMSYDQAGNLSFDNYTGQGTRTYDAENHLKQAWANGQWQTYAYGDGSRVKRIVNGTETWQVYGIGGELIAEYAAAGSPSSPQKEYGYRNGELLITAEASANIHYLVTDQLGTPRMVFDQTGALANVSRHDYLPFGEELGAGTGGRTTAQGYSASDGVRQKFTEKEHDSETGLDFFEARYYASTQGRFTGVDALMASARHDQPQSWNRYSYCVNNPLVYVDPSGLIWGSKDLGNGRQDNMWFETEKEMKGAGYSAMTSFLLQDPNGGWISFDRNSDFYEHVSDFAVANGIAQGTTSLRMAGYTAKNFWIGGLLRMQAGIPDLAESFLQEINRQVSSDPALQRDLQFFSVYSAVAGLEFGAAQSFSSASSASETTTVGRWMSPAEYEKMAATSRVQESYSTVTSVTHPPNPNLWLNAKPGSLFAEFDIPRSRLDVSANGIGKIFGPSSIFNKAKGYTEMPPATNIRVTGSK